MRRAHDEAEAEVEPIGHMLYYELAHKRSHTHNTTKFSGVRLTLMACACGCVRVCVCVLIQKMFWV